jgi:integrase
MARARGTIERRGTAWRIRIDVGVDPDTGQRKQVRRTIHGTRRDAETALIKLQAEALTGQLVVSRTAFRGVAETWHRMGVARRWEPATAIRYRVDLDQYLLPRLGDVDVAKITAADLDELYADLTSQGLSPRSIAHCHGTVRAILRYAMRKELVARNVAELAEPPRQRRRTRTLPTVAQLAEVLRLAEQTGPFWSSWFVAACATGMRPAELCALRWCDLDLAAGNAAVPQALGRIPGGYERKSTKTDRPRTVALDARTTAVLTRWRTIVAADALRLGVGLPDTAPVWPSMLSRPGGPRRGAGRHDITAPMPPTSPSHRWAAWAREVGIVDVRLYDATRHAHASWALAAGFDLATIAERLGNSPETLARTYLHSLPGRDRSVADELDRQHIATTQRGG